MKKQKIKLGVLSLVCFGLQAAAQQATLASGGVASDNGGTITYSIGQIVYKPASSTAGSVDAGVQSPYEIYVVGVNETDLDISILVYPNPTMDHLTIRIADLKDEKLVYKLVDLEGKLLACEQISGKDTQISTIALPSATYVLDIQQENKQVQSFKIIKN